MIFTIIFFFNFIDQCTMTCPSHCFPIEKAGRQDFPLEINWPGILPDLTSINQDIEKGEKRLKTILKNIEVSFISGIPS